MLRRAAALAVVAMGWILAMPTHATGAQDPPLDLTWTVPAGCPDRDYVVAEVRSLLKGTSGTAVKAEATVTTKPGGLRLTLVTRDADGEESKRELDSSDCKALADSAALFLALAINPDAGEITEPPAPSASPSVSVSAPAPPATPPRPPAPPPPIAPREETKLGVALWLAPMLGVGAAPAPAYGGGLGGGATIGPIWAALDAWVTPLQSYEVTARPGNLSVSTYALHPHAGKRFGAGEWLELTGGVEFAAVGATFDAIARSTPSRMLRVSPSVGAAGLIPMGHGIFIRAFATAMIPIVRPNYTVNIGPDEVELYRPAVVFGLLGVGVELRP